MGEDKGTDLENGRFSLNIQWLRQQWLLVSTYYQCRFESQVQAEFCLFPFPQLDQGLHSGYPLALLE